MAYNRRLDENQYVVTRLVPVHLKTVDDVMRCSHNDRDYPMRFVKLGEDALAKRDCGVEPNPIAILSDINMPEMDDARPAG